MEERVRTPPVVAIDRTRISRRVFAVFAELMSNGCVVRLTRHEATRCTFQRICSDNCCWVSPRDILEDFISHRSLRGMYLRREKKKEWWKREIRDGRATFVKIREKSRRVEARRVASIGNGNEHTGRITARAFSPIDRAHDRRWIQRLRSNVGAGRVRSGRATLGCPRSYRYIKYLIS